jgi:hypothetical protein
LTLEEIQDIENFRNNPNDGKAVTLEELLAELNE